MFSFNTLLISLVGMVQSANNSYKMSWQREPKPGDTILQFSINKSPDYWVNGDRITLFHFAVLIGDEFTEQNMTEVRDVDAQFFGTNECKLSVNLTEYDSPFVMYLLGAGIKSNSTSKPFGGHLLLTQNGMITNGILLDSKIGAEKLGALVFFYDGFENITFYQHASIGDGFVIKKPLDIHHDLDFDLLETGDPQKICGRVQNNFTKYVDDEIKQKWNDQPVQWRISYSINGAADDESSVFSDRAIWIYKGKIVEEPSTSLPTSTNSGLSTVEIIGIVLGCIGGAVVLLVLIIIYYNYAKSKQNKTDEKNTIDIDI